MTIEFPVAASPTAASASTADFPASPLAHPLPRLRWDGARQEEYAEQLKVLRPSLRECHASIRRGQLQHAFQQLGDVIQLAAISAGCRHVPNSKRPKGKVSDSPYFDGECRRMRAQFRHAARHDPDNVRILTRRISYTVCRKCRHHRQQHTPCLLRDLRSTTNVIGPNSTASRRRFQMPCRRILLGGIFIRIRVPLRQFHWHQHPLLRIHQPFSVLPRMMSFLMMR